MTPLGADPHCLENPHVYRIFIPLLALAAVLLGAPAALGQYTRDAAAVKKIDDAINQHYLVTNFDKAEAILTGTVKACEAKCSPQTLAKAWMYVGIVRGSGKSDVTGAKEAFQAAFAIDPQVILDAALATPETKAAFDEASSAAASAPPAAAPVEAPVREAPVRKAPARKAEQRRAGALPDGVNVSCTPQVSEVETRRPIPVQCTSVEELTRVELRYRAFGADAWKTVKMAKMGDSFGATIPCDVTSIPGSLSLYVRGRDAAGQDIANWGNKAEPVELELVETSREEPPVFSGGSPPARCDAEEICPPDFPGCESGKRPGGTVEWGGSCNDSAECKSGLLCIEGTCETAPICTTDADCPVGSCQGGTCKLKSSSETEGPARYKKWWFGLHFAQDVALVGGTDVCLDDNQTDLNWACYWSSSQEEAPYHSSQFGNIGPGGGGTIASGFALATRRFLLSIDHALTSNITVGLRLGYAISGGPPAGKYVEYERQGAEANTYGEVTAEGTPFLPFHMEARAAYWFGQEPLGKRGLRPYLHAGGGLAQVDARVVAKVRDDFRVGPPTPDTETGEIDAWKKLGRGFLMIGGGAAYAISPNLTFQLNLNLMLMLSASGIAIQPSAGLTYGLL